MRLVGRDVWRRSSAEWSERTRSDSAEIAAFVGQQRQSSGGIGNGEVSESEEGLRRAGPWRGAKGTPESMRAVSGSVGIGDKGERTGYMVMQKWKPGGVTKVVGQGRWL